MLWWSVMGECEGFQSGCAFLLYAIQHCPHVVVWLFQFGTISEIIFVHTNTLETHITYTGNVCDGVNGRQIVCTVAGCLATEKYYKEAGKRDCSSQSPPG